MRRLVLASQSPRRRELLDAIGACFDVLGVAIDEHPRPGEMPSAYAHRMSGAKAAAARAHRPDAWILSADTVVEIDGLILGKPADGESARGMLARLSGRTHRVLTAITLLAPDGAVHVHTVVITDVRFRRLSSQEIDEYVGTGEPFDKAGSYAVQEGGRRFVEGIDGSYTSVVGLPMERVREALAAAGLLSES